MPFTYEFTQYNTPGVGQAGGIRNQWRFTSDVAPFVDGAGAEFAPAIISHDALDLSQERSSGQIYIKTVRDFPIAELFRRGTPNGTIWVRVRDQDTGALGYVGRVRSCSWGEVEAKLLMSSASDMLQREGLRVYWQGPCGWQLYSPRCGVNREDYRTDGTLETVSADGLTVTSAAFATQPNDYFTAGLIDIAGQRRMVVSHNGPTVVLITALDGAEPGAAFSAYKGCNRSPGAGGCADFNNTANYQGCPNIPNKNVFSSGLENL